MTTADVEFEKRKDVTLKWMDASAQLMNVRFVHMGGVTRAADYPVCAHCSELAGKLIAHPCPTYQALEDADAAMAAALAADRYRHFTLNGFTQAQWDDAEREMSRAPVGVVGELPRP